MMRRIEDEKEKRIVFGGTLVPTIEAPENMCIGIIIPYG
jgi:hypothetical protein